MLSHLFNDSIVLMLTLDIFFFFRSHFAVFLFHFVSFARCFWILISVSSILSFFSSLLFTSLSNKCYRIFFPFKAFFSWWTNQKPTQSSIYQAKDRKQVQFLPLVDLLPIFDMYDVFISQVKSARIYQIKKQEESKRRICVLFSPPQYGLGCV